MSLLSGSSALYFQGRSASSAYFNGSLVWSTPAQQQGIVTNQLFLELDAANYTSGLWNDETGNGNNATISGPTWSSTDGGIFDFDGVNDIITVPHNSNLSLSAASQRTIQMWVKFDNLPASPNRMIFFSKLSSNFSFDGYWGGVHFDGTAVVATNGTAISKTTYSTSTISINSWYLFTFISQITSTANTTKVYINESEYISTFHGSDGYSESNVLTLGYFSSPTAGLGQGVYLNGKVGAVYFYTKGLSVVEISQNYNATKGRFGL